MKKWIISVAIIMALAATVSQAFAAGCCGDKPAAGKEEPGATTNSTAQARLEVGNILCGACAKSVTAALTATTGVQSAVVGTDKVAQVSYDRDKVDVQALIKAIVTARHPHEGMHFTAKPLK